MALIFTELKESLEAKGHAFKRAKGGYNSLAITSHIGRKVFIKTF